MSVIEVERKDMVSLLETALCYTNFYDRSTYRNDYEEVREFCVKYGFQIAGYIKRHEKAKVKDKKIGTQRIPTI